MTKEIVTKQVYTNIQSAEYVAMDGKRFSSEEKCVKHEKDLVDLADFAERHSVKNIENEGIFKAMYPDNLGSVYVISINIPLVKDDTFRTLFSKSFDHYYGEYGLPDEFEGEIILIEFIEKNYNSRDEYSYEKCTKDDVLKALNESVKYFENL